MNNPPKSDAFHDLINTVPISLEEFAFFDLLNIKTQEQVGSALAQALQSGHVEPGTLVRGATVPEGEPSGRSYLSVPRCGVQVNAIDTQEGPQITSGAIYFTEGKQHRFALDSISLTPMREQAILHGCAGGIVDLNLYYPSYLAERHLHGPGSVHDILIYGMGHVLRRFAVETIEIPDPETGEATPVRTDKLASILPASRSEVAADYLVTGPVVRVANAPLPILGHHFRQIDMTCGLTGDNPDEPFNIRILVPDTVPDWDLPIAEGDTVEAIATLCARLWIANVD